MFTDHKLEEVGIMLQEKRKTDMKTGSFATLQGVRGVQFGREIYTTVVKFKDLDEFLMVFPEVQREVTPQKVGKIKTYIMSGLEEENEYMRFFSALTATSRGHIFYDETTGRIAIDTINSKLSINDGQHRYYAAAETLDFTRRMTINARTKEEREKYRVWTEKLENMVIPLVIFNQISEKQEKQLFHDINNLAARPSRSATIRLAQTDLIATMARELSERNKFMTDYGVEYNKGSIGANNPNLMLLTTIYLSIKELVKTLDQKGLVYFDLSEEGYESTYTYINETFNEVFRALPYDIQNKHVYIGHKHFAFKGIMRYVRKARMQSIPEPLIFAAIKNVDWTVNVDYWGKYGAIMSRRSNALVFPAGETSVESITSACFEELDKIVSEGE